MGQSTSVERNIHVDVLGKGPSSRLFHGILGRKKLGGRTKQVKQPHMRHKDGWLTIRVESLHQDLGDILLPSTFKCVCSNDLLICHCCWSQSSVE